MVARTINVGRNSEFRGGCISENTMYYRDPQIVQNRRKVVTFPGWSQGGVLLYF